MPFTLAHPAAIIPIFQHSKGEKLCLSALIVGSMVPDLGYFVPVPEFSRFSHALSGIILFGLPIGLLVLWLFHYGLKQSILARLSRNNLARFQALATPFPFLPWSRLGLILLSLLLGALTHIAWDSMTHGQGWVVRQVPFFRSGFMTLARVDLLVYFVFKHASSIFGVTFIIFHSWQWYHGKTTSRLSNLIIALLLWLLALGGGMIIAVVSTWLGYHHLRLFAQWGLAGLIVVGLVYLFILKRNKFSTMTNR